MAVPHDRTTQGANDQYQASYPLDHYGVLAPRRMGGMNNCCDFVKAAISQGPTRPKLPNAAASRKWVNRCMAESSLGARGRSGRRKDHDSCSTLGCCWLDTLKTYSTGSWIIERESLAFPGASAIRLSCIGVAAVQRGRLTCLVVENLRGPVRVVLVSR